MLGENLLKNDVRYGHHFKLRDASGIVLSDHGGIWLFELEKFHKQLIDNEIERWLKFFNEGAALNDEELPDWMQTKEMEQAMNTLRVFSEKEHEYERYRARQEYIRIRETERSLLEQALKREEQALKREEQALKREEQERQAKEAILSEKEAALSEIAHLRKLLEEKLGKDSA